MEPKKELRGWVTTDQILDYLARKYGVKISDRTIYRWARIGWIGKLKVGQKAFFWGEDVMRQVQIEKAPVAGGAEQ